MKKFMNCLAFLLLPSITFGQQIDSAKTIRATFNNYKDLTQLAESKKVRVFLFNL